MVSICLVKKLPKEAWIWEMHPNESIQPKIWAPKASQIHFNSADDNTYYLSVCCIVASVSFVDMATTIW